MTDIFSIRIGSFVLLEHLASGAAGQVWRARHERFGYPAAVKLLTGSRHGRQAESFQREIRAVARLNHPHVTPVYDYGVVSEEEAATDPSGAVSTSDLWFVMELASDTLGSCATLTHYGALRRLALQLLDGLAHCHARQIIHRDLKPANVLVFDGEDGLPIYRLADFGLAHDATDDLFAVRSGTPAFMAPEQIDGDWRSYGPATDLYALGCLLVSAVVGRSPFSRSSVAATLRAHLEPRPALSWPFPVPEGFAAWLDVLLARRPEQRFDCAADAARGLIGLGEAAGEGEARASSMVSAQTTDLSSGLLTLDCLLAPRPVVGRAGAGESAPPRPEVDANIVPESWRTTFETSTSAHRPGTGLSLFGLRHVPFVGRDEERDRLWSMLRYVAESKATRCLVIEGESGSGKSRLVQWLGERAAEVGAATVLTAFHSANPGPRDGLGPMFEQALASHGLSRAELVPHIRRRFDVSAEQAQAAARLLRPLEREPGEAPLSQSVRGATARQLIAAVQRRAGRPLIIWLDDAQWSEEAIILATSLATAPAHRQMPLLVLVTAQTEALFERSLERDKLESLSELSVTTRFTLRRLSTNTFRDLVQQLLPMAPALATELAERCAGVPLFAIHLLGDWVERGLVSIGDDGFVRPLDADVTLPDTLHSVWTSRLARCFSSKESRRAMEVAAALGLNPDAIEWEIACREAGVTAERSWLSRADEFGLVHTGPDHFSLSHALLRESLVRAAREAGHWRDLNLACDRMLVLRYGIDNQPIALRRGHHLSEAGAWVESLTPLTAGFRYQLNHDTTDQAARTLARRGDALHRAEADGHEVGHDRLIQKLSTINLATAAGRWKEAEQLIARLRPQIDASTQHRDRAMFWRLHARTSFVLKHNEEALRAYQLSLREAEAAGDPEHVLMSLYKMSRFLNHLGRPEEALARINQSTAHQDFAGFRVFRLLFAEQRARILIGRGETEAARQLLEATANELTEHDGFGVRYAILLALGDLLRQLGHLEQARPHYLRARELMLAVDSKYLSTAQYNIALLDLQRGDVDAAAEVLLGLVHDGQLNDPEMTPYIHAGLMACAAGRGDEQLFDEHFEALAHHRAYDHDLGLTTEMAARFWQAHGDDSRARDSFVLALDQWRQLGNTAHIVEITQLLETGPRR